MDLAWKRNGIIFFYVCARECVWKHKQKPEVSSSVFTDCSHWVWSSPIQRQCLLSKPHQGTREQTRVLRLEQKVFYWLTYFPSLISFLSKANGDVVRNKIKNPQEGEGPQGRNSPHPSLWDRVLCSPSCPWTRHVADDTWDYRLEAPCLTSHNISHWLFNKVMFWIYRVKQGVLLKQLPCGSRFLLQLIRMSPCAK